MLQSKHLSLLRNRLGLRSADCRKGASRKEATPKNLKIVKEFQEIWSKLIKKASKIIFGNSAKGGHFQGKCLLVGGCVETIPCVAPEWTKIFHRYSLANRRSDFSPQARASHGWSCFCPMQQPTASESASQRQPGGAPPPQPLAVQPGLPTTPVSQVGPPGVPIGMGRPQPTLEPKRPWAKMAKDRRMEDPQWESSLPVWIAEKVAVR